MDISIRDETALKLYELLKRRNLPLNDPVAQMNIMNEAIGLLHKAEFRGIEYPEKEVAKPVRGISKKEGKK